MIRFAVLNEDDQPKSKHEESVEIQAEKCLGIYESAIRLLQKGKLEESQAMFKNLVESELLQKIDNDVARGTSVRRLQYLVYTNYASILEQSSDESAKTALSFYLKAVAFDDSDNTLWIKIGTLAAQDKKLRLARYALECGLQQSDRSGEVTDVNSIPGALWDQDLTPSQWRCLETLCEVLYEIGDYVACEDYVQKALRISPYFDRGLELLEMISNRLQDTADDFNQEHLNGTLTSNSDSKEPKELILEELTWLNLGEQLLAEYKSLLAASGNGFYNQRLVVRLQKTTDEDVEMPEQEPEVTEESVMPAELEIVADTNMAADVKMETSVPSTTEANMAAVVSSDDTADQGDKENTEGEQSAAMKRKRKEVEERSGLRTSKRVRDKLDQFEVTKKKREEEELEILAKYRVVLSKFGLDLENGYIAGTFPGSRTSDEIFPHGLSALLQTFNKHLERPNALVQASTIEHVQQQKTNHFAIFTQAKDEQDTAPLFQDNGLLLEFINTTNERNSGVVEYLCEFLVVFVANFANSESGSNWQRKWPFGMRLVLSEIVSTIGDQLLEYLNQECMVTEQESECKRQLARELPLSICEMYLDEMVHATLQPFTVTSRRSRGAKRVDADNVKRLEEQYLRWLYLAGLGLDPVMKQLPSETGVSEQSTWSRSAALRLNWAQGRHAQCMGNAPEAITRFERCLETLSDDATLSITLPNCKYDTTLDAESVQERLGRLKTHQYVLDAERLFQEKDYSAVLARLGPIFLTKDSKLQAPGGKDIETSLVDTIGGSLSEKLGLMNLLYKHFYVNCIQSCEALGHRTQQFQCISGMFIQVVETLVNTITDKSEAVEIWFLFGQVSQTLYLLRETLQSSKLSDLTGTLDAGQLQVLMCCVLVIARLGFVNVLHQDRLVDDDIKTSYSDLLKHRPHLSQFNLVLVRVWLVLLLILPGWFQDETDGKDDKDHPDGSVSEPALPLRTQPLDTNALDLDSDTIQRVLSQPLTSNSSTPIGLYSCPSRELYMELIALVHDDFGVREICGIDNNQLIQLALKVSSPMRGEFYRKEENQCYYCFYGISLSVDGQYPIEHSSEPVDFDKKAAIEFYPLLERSLSNKVLRGQVRGDLKDAVDRVEEALGSPPYESNSILEMNRQLIDSYLASDINFAEAIQVNSKSRLPTMSQPPSSKLPCVYKRIYSIQGKIFLAQFRNKAKNNQFKPLEDLQHAIDQFRTDIHVNPSCWDSWYALATCYAFLADENLVFSASDIKNNYSKITDLQKRAFHCFSQAVRITPKRLQHVLGSTNDSLNPEPVSRPEGRSAESSVELSQNATSEILEPSEDGESRASEDVNDTNGAVALPDTGREWYQQQAAFWFDFGNLVHGILSKPMRMEAMRRSAGQEGISDAGEPVTISIPEPTEEQVYKFAAFCFKRSLKLNDQNWRTPLMLGKCIEKLNGKTAQTLALYRISANLVPARSGQPGNEKIFEAAYKVISTLSKYLYANKVETLITKTLTKSKLSAADGESFIFEPPKEYLQAIETNSSNEEDLKKSERLRAFRLLCEALARIRHTDKRHWHHRPVYRQAWILYHVYHDVERAKAEMLSLFQIKSNLKTLVSSVWKPEFERSGKHFVYVGEYTKFLIILAKETKDVETLNSLARKIRRAQGLLLDLKEIWELLYDSYLSVLEDLVGPDPVLAVAEVIPRTEFREKAPIYEAKMFDQEPKLPGLVVLQRLCELKKLNDKMAPEGQMSHLLAVCYSKLFMEVGGADLYPKELVRQLSSSSELPMMEEPAVSGGIDSVAVHQAAEVEGETDRIAKSDQGADDEGAKEEARPKTAQLSATAIQVDPSTGSPVTIATTAPQDAQESLTSDAKGSETENQGETKDRSELDSAAESATMPLPTAVNLDAASSPAPSSGAKDSESCAAMDVEPDMQDWKNRKKISEAELASRATNMCKAPPPSLKAPQTLQSKLAGPDNAHSQEDTVMTGPSDESGDTNMAEEQGQDRANEQSAADNEGAAELGPEPDGSQDAGSQSAPGPDEGGGPMMTEEHGSAATSTPAPTRTTSRRNSKVET
ncbi:Histone transcription regulator 3 [Mortierella alpina]|uniref:Histone transcription regulator 3 n=1 Tax=Mortierella alpina TaxID=64518 RepID=A0A9P6JEV5_MORAP|nr:Histone transcription regulator 3 [Mortierella alpina]